PTSTRLHHVARGCAILALPRETPTKRANPARVASIGAPPEYFSHHAFPPENCTANTRRRLQRDPHIKDKEHKKGGWWMPSQHGRPILVIGAANICTPRPSPS